MKVLRLAFPIFVVLSVVGCGVAYKTKATAVEQAPSEQAAAAPAKLVSETVTLAIGGLECGMCATKVASALETAGGVQSATVDLESKKATVVYDSKKTDPKKLAQVVNATPDMHGGTYSATIAK